MSKINVVDAITYLENVAFELMHQEERTITIGIQTFKCNELNDNIVLLDQMMKFVLNKKCEGEASENV
jgi:hypothetical protein